MLIVNFKYSNRLADNYYLDRFGLLRGSLHHSSTGLVAPGPGVANIGSVGVNNGSVNTVSGGPSVPFNLVRYSEFMNSQTERLINDERHRLLNQTLSQNSYKPSAQSIDSPALHHNLGSSNSSNINNININNNERLLESNGEPIHVNHSLKQDFSVNSLSSGSILSGTPCIGRDRDAIGSSALVNLGRKHNINNISAVKPLNLSSNCEQTPVNCSSEQIWRPQSDDQKEQTTYSTNNMINNSNRLDTHLDTHYAINRRNSLLTDETSKANKSFRGNSIESVTAERSADRFADRMVSSEHKSSLMSSECNANEGLHSRMLDNHLDKSVVNENKDHSTFSSDRTRPEVINCQINDKSLEVSNTYEDRLISKLDLEEIKLKQRRVNKYIDEVFSSDEESDLSDSDDNEDKYRIILSKRMPLELDANQDKMHFLGIFNLTTHKRKSQLEFNKYVKRNKILRQCSPELIIDPIDLISQSKDENNESPDSILTASHISPDCVNSEENRPEVKLHFMSTLGLCEQSSAEKKRNIELVWTGITKERLLRNKRNKCWSKVFNNLDEHTLHKWLISLESIIETNPVNCTNGSISSAGFIGFNGFIGGNNYNSKTSVNCFNNSSRSQRKVILFNNKQSTNSDLKSGSANTGSSWHSMVNKSDIHSNKDFAQEFHESVLLETTKQQKSRLVVNDQHINNNAKCNVESTKQHHNHHRQQHHQQQQHHHNIITADLSPASSSYKWPGIESVMEAYDRYSYGLSHI